ncbi:MAG TPA: hypothetical protein VMT52_11825, partial [Planctomycetota bacterium]|nr:hypothetical protein [Planctomycetota bacterium]
MATVEAIRTNRVKTNSACRACNSSRLHNILVLGPTPLANRFLTPEEIVSSIPEPLYPLDVYSCEDCGLLQLVHVVSPEVLFRDYIYVSTISDALAKHFASLAAD